MRPRVLLLALGLLGSLLIGCGVPAPADHSLASASIAATSMPLATVPSTPTSAPPTATIAPTVTTTPTAEPSVVPEEATVAPEVIASDVNDTPVLSDQAGVDVNDQPVAAMTLSEPVRLQIPAIELDYRPVSVGLDKNRVPIVLDHDVAWYNLSAMPGQGDNIVFWAHVLRFVATPKIPAPFARVKELKPGALVIVTTANGEQVHYKVTKSVQVTPNQVEFIMPTGKEQVTLVSCIGDKVIAGGELTKKYRLITIAERVQ